MKPRLKSQMMTTPKRHTFLLKRFWMTNGHITRNIMKRRQNIIGRCSRRPPPYPSTPIVAPIHVASDTPSTPVAPTIMTLSMELVPSRVTRPPSSSKMFLNQSKVMYCVPKVLESGIEKQLIVCKACDH